MRYAEILNGKVVRVIECEPEKITGFAGVWNSLENYPEVSIGWKYSGGVYSVPDPKSNRTLLKQEEFIDAFTSQEWRKIKKAASGASSPSPVLESDSEIIDQVLDSIRITGAIDVSSKKANKFYNALKDSGIINAARKQILNDGIPQ